MINFHSLSWSHGHGQETVRVAMGVDVLARLHQQIQQVLISMRDERQGKLKV